jgi:hypothetical protein
LAGTTLPDRGNMKLGAGVKLGYFAQHAMEILQPQLTVIGMMEATFPLATLGTAHVARRVLELTPEVPRTYGGGYDEYVAQTGQEAPGLRQ